MRHSKVIRVVPQRFCAVCWTSADLGALTCAQAAGQPESLGQKLVNFDGRAW